MEGFEVVIYFAIGCALGFILGYIVRSIREIKEEVHVIVENDHHHVVVDKDEEDK